MKVLHLNQSDINGGAARATYRIHHALRKKGIDSTLLVNVANSGDWTVISPKTKAAKAWAQARPHVGGFVNKLMKTQNSIIHSASILPSGRIDELNNSKANILHLHWVQGEMLSIADIGQIKKPTVWTLHDMWAFCGAEHVTWDERWRQGYRSNNRPAHESGFDINRWTWARKRRHWDRPIQIVTPSKWLAECVKNSALMKDWPVSVIPNCLDMGVWKPVEQKLARELLNLPRDRHLLLFGTSGANLAHHKGFDLLVEALNHLRGEISDMEIIVFGQHQPQQVPDLGFPVHYIGHLHDDVSMRLLYSAADALVIPSRIDNLPNTGLESVTCGTPVIGFDVCGLPDIVEHRVTGYLAKSFETDDLAFAIKWTLENLGDKQNRNKIRKNSYERFSEEKISRSYLKIYEAVIKNELR